MRVRICLFGEKGSLAVVPVLKKFTLSLPPTILLLLRNS